MQTYLFVVKFEIFSEFPTSSLLFATRRAIVREVGITVIVEESWHVLLLER